MAHITNCPSCRAEIQIPETLFGQRVKCPTCGEHFGAPTSVGIQPEPIPHAQFAAAPAPTQVEPGTGHFRCPFCKTSRRPSVRQEISTAGWIVFAILLVSGCFSLFCWIGLLMKDDVHHCSDCGMKLGGGGSF